MSDDAKGGPVTLVITRLVKPGREADFEAWLREAQAVGMTYPGFIGVEVLRPRDHARPEYVIIARFASYETLRAWTESDVRKQLMARSSAFAQEDSREKVITGLERWFTLPDSPLLHPPPRWKMCVVSGLVAYPLGLALGTALGPLIASWPYPLQSLAISLLMMVLMTYVFMPRATRLFARFLYPPPPEPQASVEPG